MSFSKKIAVTILSTYVAAVAGGIFYVIYHASNFPEFLAFVAAPTTVILSFYFNKAKAENTQGGITYDLEMKEQNCDEDNNPTKIGY